MLKVKKYAAQSPEKLNLKQQINIDWFIVVRYQLISQEQKPPALNYI